MELFKSCGGLAVVIAALLLAPSTAGAEKTKILSGLMGGQDDRSKQLEALPPGALNETARRDLLSVLGSAKIVQDLSRNVEGIVFVSRPYETYIPYVCRRDRVTLTYQLEDRQDPSGKPLPFGRKPAGVETQPMFHIEHLPVPDTGHWGVDPVTRRQIPGPVTLCDADHPARSANWFAAPSTMDAIRAANLFRMAEDQVKSGQLAPGPCDAHGKDTCRQWLAALDDPSKITSVEPCEPNTANNACYVISFDRVDVTIIGQIPSNTSEPFWPTAIKSVQVDDVVELFV